MAGPNLPVNVDATYDDSPTDASRKTHQQHHDLIHDAINDLFDPARAPLNVLDYADLSAALTAAPAGATIYIPGGTTSAAAGLQLTKSVTIVGDGPTSVIAASGAYGFGSVTSGSGARVTFRNVAFTGSSSAIFQLTRPYTYSARFFDCTFKSFAAIAIQTFGTDILCVRCEFSTDGTPGAANAVQLLGGPQSVKLIDCTFRFLFRGLYGTSTYGFASHVEVEGCTFDGGWQYLKSTASGSGGAVTYAATTVTDTGAAFGSIPANSTVRAMAAKRTGTITTIAATGVSSFTDSGADFVTAGVLRGDIVRTASLWGVVDEVTSVTVLKIEEWLDLTTYESAPAPATSTAYTVYGLVIGKVASNTGTVITVDLWRNWNGTVATPAAGTRYEVAPKTDYQCWVSYAEKVRIVNNTVRRAWADCISVMQVRNAIIADNNVYDGQDVGITVGNIGIDTPGVVVADNRISHIGTAGIWLGQVIDSEVVGNVIEEAQWVSPSSTVYGAIQVEVCSRVDISHNTIKRISAPSSTRAIHLYGTSGAIADLSLVDNRSYGFSTQDITITGSNVTGITGRFQTGTVITLASSAVGPRGEFSGTGSPESVLAASQGALYRRTTGTLYIKESGTGTTGWVLVTTPTSLIEFMSTLGNHPAIGQYGSASQVLSSANQAILTRFKPYRDITVSSLRWVTGTASSGNYDIGIYSSTGTLLWSKGSTAWPGTNTAVQETVSPTVAMTAGVEYLIAFSADNTTGTFRGTAEAVTNMVVMLDGSTYFTRSVASSFPLPSPITPGSTRIGKAVYVMIHGT